MSFDEGPKKPAKLVVVVAFDPDEEGNLQTVFGPQDFPTEDKAVRTAQTLADAHRGVLAWSREADMHLGEYGPPTILFQHGDTLDME